MRVAARIVFHLLEGDERDLPIIGEVGVVLSDILVQFSAVEEAVKRVSAADGPMDQVRLGPVNRLVNVELWNPPAALRLLAGRTRRSRCR